MKTHQNITNIYEELGKSEVDCKSWQSNLYCPVNSVSTELINKYVFKSNVTTFRSSDGQMWYDIPFAFTPFWNSKSNLT